jgi:PAS domain S-box-containing protein
MHDRLLSAQSSASPLLSVASATLMDLLALSPDALVVVDQAGTITQVNAQALALFGYGEEELIGRPLETLIPGRFHEIHVSHRERYMATPHTRPMGVNLELFGRRRDGSEFPVDISLRPVLVDECLHVISAVRDVTAQHIAERERMLQAERLRLQTDLLNLSREAILTRDPISRVLTWSRGAERLYGWTAQEALGRVIYSLLKTHFPTNRLTFEAQLERDGQWEGELVHTRRDGSTILVHSHQMLIRDEQGEVTAILEVNQDITERQQLTETVQQAHEALALVIHQDVTSFKEAEHLKDEFIGVAAHELRAPLAVLKSAVSMLCLQTARGHGPQLADWQQEVLQEIEQATNRLSALTEDLLDVTRLQAGKLLIHPQQANIIPLVQRIVTSLQPTTTRHHLVVHTQLTTLETQIDVGRIEQVLINLINNAIKYSPQGGTIEITITEEPITKMAQISIHDQGIGIPQDQQAQIFGRFVRADNAYAAGIHGTGLGLYLCREFIEQHGGRIWFESTEGKGSTFFLTLPEQGILDMTDSHEK